MCRPASMLVTKKRVLWSKTTDSHTALRREFGIAEEKPGRIIQAVAIEITPPETNGVPDFAADPDQWNFCVDQDMLPKWWDAEEAEARVRQRLGDWIAERVVTVGRDIQDGEMVYVCRGVTAGFNYGTVAINHGTVTENHGTVTHNYGTVTENHGTVTRNCGTVTRNCGTVTRNYGTVTRNYVTVTHNHGTVTENHGTVTENHGTVVENYGTVEAISGGQVVSYKNLSPDILKQSGAVLIDRSGYKVVCHVKN